MELTDKTYYYTFNSIELSFYTTRLFSFNEFDGTYYEALILDFQKATWVTPFGILFLYSLANQLNNEYPNLKIRFIFSGENFSYLCRMHLYKKLSAMNNISCSPEPVRYSEYDRTDTLEEIKFIDFVDQYDTDIKAGELFQLISINTKPCEDNSNIINTALSEIFDNIYSHSGKQQAIIVAQAHKNYIRIAIGDTGIGIPNKLRTKKEYRDLDDNEIIVESLKPYVTTRSGGGGWGLTDLNETITDSQVPGVLMIRSNLGWIWSRAGFSQSGKTNFNIEGTYIGLLLRREN